MLVKARANLWARNGAGQTALHVAAAAGRVKLVGMLLMTMMANAAPDLALQLLTRPAPHIPKIPASALKRLVDRAGQTPLHAAAASLQGAQPCKPAVYSSWPVECHFFVFDDICTARQECECLVNCSS